MDPTKTIVIYIYVTQVNETKSDWHPNPTDVFVTTEISIDAPADHHDKPRSLSHAQEFLTIEGDKPYENFKYYYYDTRQDDVLLLVMQHKYINVLSCTQDEFISFFSEQGTTYDDEYLLIDLFNSIIHKRNMFSSKHIETLLIFASDRIHITHANVVDRLATMENNGLTDRDNYLISNTPVPTGTSNKLAIGIFTHGKFIREGQSLSLATVPDAFSITKQNVGAFGCETISSDKNGWRGFNATLDAWNDKFITNDAYIKKLKDYISRTGEKELNVEEGICTQFKDKRVFFTKKYYFDVNNETIIFLRIKDGRFNCINIINCDQEIFDEFFTLPEYRYGSLFDDFNSNVEDILTTMDEENYITSKQIFKLIDPLKYDGISEVIIYDKSCNTIPADPEYDGPFVFDKCSLVPHIFKKPGVGFGGRKTNRKLKRKTKRIKRHKN